MGKSNSHLLLYFGETRFGPCVLKSKKHNRIEVGGRDTRRPGYSPNEAVLTCAASLSKYQYLTKVEEMYLLNINLDNVPEACYLGDIHVERALRITNVKGDISCILEKIKCYTLRLFNMKFTTLATQSLLTALSTGVESLVLEDSVVELDVDTLATYNGQGVCRRVSCWGQAKEDYAGKVRSWGQRMGWQVIEGNGYICIEMQE